MTKLFSMKSLAFAGATAFALALAAAPQADAAESTKPGMVFQQVATETGKLKNDVTAEYASIIVSQSAVNITDEKLEYYYSTVKSGNPKKWKAVSTSHYRIRENDNYFLQVPISEITKYKAANVYIAVDAAGNMKLGPIECKAAPKLKAAIKNLASGPSIELSANRAPVKDGWIWGESQYNGFSFSVYGDELENSAKDLIVDLQNIADFGGGTVNLTYSSEDDMIPTATTKLKIPGVANAPKLGLKIAKAFNIKIKNTIGYRTFTADTKDTSKIEFTQGTNSTLTMKDLFGATNVSKSGGDMEALENNMKVQIKTLAKGKKLDSRIGTTTVYASAATPQALNAVIKNQISKKVTDASIEFKTDKLELTQAKSVSNSAVVVLEYKTKDAKKWTEVKSGKSTITFKNAKLPDEIYVRVKGTDESTKTGKTAAYEAPGHVMTIKIDKNNPEKSTYITK